MLLRHDSPHDRDPDIFHTMTSHNPEADDPQLHHHDIPTEHHSTANPNFDSTNMNSNNNNNLDDVWGDDDDDDNTPPPHHHHHHPHSQYTHQPHHRHQHPPPREISDIPRLSQAHTNAGYRDGITLAKSLTAQQGFDEGYGLGAHIGARAGQLLGVLEGLAAAVGLHLLSSSGGGEGLGGQAAAEARRIEALLGEARRELSVRGVFEAEYWAGDGNWRYEVLQEAAGGSGGMGGEGVVFSDVAEAHPLLRKWRGIVRGEAARYGVDWEVLKDGGVDEARRGEEEEGREREREGKARRERENRPAVRGKEGLAW